MLPSSPAFPCPAAKPDGVSSIEHVCQIRWPNLVISLARYIYLSIGIYWGAVCGLDCVGGFVDLVCFEGITVDHHETS